MNIAEKLVWEADMISTSINLFTGYQTNRDATTTKEYCAKYILTSIFSGFFSTHDVKFTKKRI